LQLPPRFKDTSLHINQTPSFDKGQPDGTVLLLWVDHPDRALSSLSGQVSCFRVSLARYTEDDE
jgi:hypothetical protein